MVKRCLHPTPFPVHCITNVEASFRLTDHLFIHLLFCNLFCCILILVSSFAPSSLGFAVRKLTSLDGTAECRPCLQLCVCICVQLYIVLELGKVTTKLTEPASLWTNRPPTPLGCIKCVRCGCYRYICNLQHWFCAPLMTSKKIHS